MEEIYLPEHLLITAWRTLREKINTFGNTLICHSSFYTYLHCFNAIYKHFYGLSVRKEKNIDVGNGGQEVEDLIWGRDIPKPSWINHFLSGQCCLRPLNEDYFAINWFRFGFVLGKCGKLLFNKNTDYGKILLQWT